MRKIWMLAAVAMMLLGAAVAQAQGSGDIEGAVTREDGSGIGGVTVVINETGDATLTKSNGTFVFSGVPEGTYTMSFSLGDNADTESVEVSAGGLATVDKSVDWQVSFVETITVYSASRRQERIVDAPASVSAFSEVEIEREASTGQLAKVVEFAPGVEITQSGIYDFNLNMRGFNSSLNRRVQPIVDGRDPTVPFLSSTEWSYLSNLQDLANVELVRGPSSALYGANAFNGVLNMITKAPRDAQGGKINIAFGELETLKGDILWAGSAGNDWYYKVNGNYTEGEDFVQERTVTSGTEYPGLPFELGTPDNEYDNSNISLRFDKHFDSGHVLTLEGGQFEGSGGTTVTGIGRVNVGDVERPFARFNYSTNNFNVLAYYNGRESPDQLALASAGRIFLDSDDIHFEVQTNQDFGDRFRLVAGASYSESDIDTGNFNGQQTLTFRPVDGDFTAVFAQLDIDINDDLKLVLAGRWDDSSLHDSQISPKAALVWSINDSNTLRFTYNEAFQVANFSEFFLDAPTAIPGVGAAIDLRGIEALLCAPFGVDCGFGAGPTRVRALGNANLDLEEIQSFEIGYSGIIAGKAYLTIDYYQNEIDNFITDLIPNPFGTINPAFGPYTPPPGHPAPGLLLGTLQGALGPAFGFLSRNVDGTPIFALASYTNAGAVDTDGIDLGLNYYINNQWVFDFSYSFFDFDVKEQTAAGDRLIPNAPENKYSLGLTYTGSKWGGSAKYRWVDDFDWAAGAFFGPVEDYSVLNLNGSYKMNDNVTFALNISNASNDIHYESFGGDLLERRAMFSVTFTW